MTNGLDYAVWRKDFETILEGLQDKHVLMTYSGGKDSSLILYFIQQAADEFGFNFETHAVPFPAHVLTADETDKLSGYWQEKGIRIIWHPISVADDKLKDAVNRKISPCMVCNQTKKEILTKFFKESRLPLNQTVIIVNYSLWDLVSATVEHILGGIYRDEKKVGGFKGKPPKERFIETSQRFYPLLKLKGGLTIYKPLIRYNDQDIIDFISENRIPLTSTACKYREFRPKRLFAAYYEKMDLNFKYANVLGFVKNSLNIPEVSYYEETDMEKYLTSII